MTEFDEVYRRYFGDVYRYLLALSGNEAVAEEITQQTFFKAMQHLDTFDGRCKLYVWLCQIAKNTYFNHRNKEKRIDRGVELDTLCGDEEMERSLLSREAALEAYRAVHRLEEPYKEVFLLRAFGELPFAQIAELFSRTESWARVTYHRARLKLKEELS